MEAESKHWSVKELEVSGGLNEVLEGEKRYLKIREATWVQ